MLRVALILGLFGVTVTLAAYRPAPGRGFVLERCHHEVEAGASIWHVPQGLKVRELSGVEYVIPRCDVSDGEALFLDKMGGNDAPLPPDYDGWTAYTAFPSSNNKSFDTFLGDFSVPDKPKHRPAMLFIFTGLQNEDWIPKVDPEPKSGFDIIQPVLQYPGDFGHYWSIKSWYVVTDVGTIASKEVRVEPGDVIFGNMTRTGATSWFINSVSKGTGRDTFINVDHPRLKSQPWAYNTIECYGCKSCSTYPEQACKFTNLAITQGAANVPAQWQITPKTPAKLFCHEKAVVNSPTAVDFPFQ